MRDAGSDDLDRLYALCLECFPSEPWSRSGLEEELTRETTICHVLERDGVDVVGYLVAWRVLDELHLMQIAVDAAWRRLGLAGLLLDALLDEARAGSSRVVYLEVRASNSAARELYESRGFATIGLRRGYYDHPMEDAVVMALTLGPAG